LFSITKRLVASKCVLVDPVIPLAAYKTASADWKLVGTSTRCAMELNVYSHRHAAGETGKALAQAGMFLQPPGSDFRHVSYENPQCLDLDDVMDVEESTPDFAESHEINDGNFNSTQDFSSVLDHLSQPKYLKELEVDERIITSLHRCVLCPNHLKIEIWRTGLRSSAEVARFWINAYCGNSYQREAVDFVSRRETKTLPLDSTLWKRHSSQTGLP
jgi:hypothetical protein